MKLINQAEKYQEWFNMFEYSYQVLTNILQSFFETAICRGDNGFVRLLIKVNANVNGKTFEGLTPAILAAKKNQTDVLKVLIENGSDINAQGDYIFSTALHEAAYEGRLRAVMVLIENGANINQQDEVDYTPLIVATENDKPEVTAYLLDNGANINSQNIYGTSLAFVINVLDNLIACYK